MTTPEDHRVGVLALCGDPKPMHTLLDHLRQLGYSVDTAGDLQDARTSFFGAGGHDCLVVGPDVQPGLAQRVVSSLKRVDPHIAVATFGPTVGLRAPLRSARLASLHPSSRAGQGALLRFLRGL
ncbi:MAG: hypothetical protein AB8H80_14995 [Planctomycetota bacterium]